MDASKILSSWVPKARLRLGMMNINHSDERIFKNIVVWRRNLWTQYYNLPLENEKVPDNHEWAFDEITQEATLMLVSFYMTNPLGDKKSSSTINNVIAIIGNRKPYKWGGK